jgi:RNA polymerase sigma-70 factor, ECF subfamily
VPGEFAALFDEHRRELRAHCYRMTGSLADAEDLTQEGFLRAWRNADRFEGRSSLRTWLYRITTNACLDFLKSHQRRAQPTDSIAETLEREAWIDPYPDHHDPADTVADGETTDLYLIVALAHLPPRQRAAVIARDLLDFDAARTASILGCTVTAANSLLQRARTRLRHLAPNLDNLIRPDRSADNELVHAYIRAHRRGDVDAILELLDRDVRISMPPEAPCVGALDARSFFARLLGADGPRTWQLVPTRANDSPAIANYLQRPGDTGFRALSIDILHLHDGRIAAIHCFLGDATFPAFGLEGAIALEGRPHSPFDRGARRREGVRPRMPLPGCDRLLLGALGSGKVDVWQLS